MSRISNYFRNHWARSYPLRTHLLFCLTMMLLSILPAMLCSLTQLQYGAEAYWLSVVVTTLFIGPFTIVMSYIEDLQ